MTDTEELTARHIVPGPPVLAETLEMMLGRPAVVRDVGWFPPVGASPTAVGSYVDDTGTLRGCAWVDLPLAAAMGAAMSMVPADQAAAAVRTGRLPEDFRGNLHEVLNIASALLNEGGAAHLRIRTLEIVEDGLTEDLLALLADPRAAGYFAVDLGEYGNGLLSVTLGD